MLLHLAIICATISNKIITIKQAAISPDKRYSLSNQGQIGVSHDRNTLGFSREARQTIEGNTNNKIHKGTPKTGDQSFIVFSNKK